MFMKRKYIEIWKGCGNGKFEVYTRLFPPRLFNSFLSLKIPQCSVTICKASELSLNQIKTTVTVVQL
jgi:hypothetical protein